MEKGEIHGLCTFGKTTAGENGTMFRSAALTLLCLMALAASATNAAAQTEVQLRSFVVPTKPANPTAKKEGPITVLFTVANSENAFFVCEMSPRVRDAMMETLFYNPIPVSAQNVMDVSTIQPLLMDAANKALRQPMILGIKVEPGVKELVTGSSRSRAAAIGCGEVDKAGAKGKQPPAKK